MRDLLTDRETAKILGMRINSLYRIVDKFDDNPDDEWDLEEGIHFEFAGPPASAGRDKGKRPRRFTEEGIEALARFLEATEKKGILNWFLDFRDRLFQAKKKRKQLLVTRRITQEFMEPGGALVIQGKLAFLSKKTTVSILQTNFKGFNNSWKRLRKDGSDQGEDALRINRDFILDDNRQELISQIGVRRVADDMLLHSKITKARKVWIEAVGEVIVSCIDAEIRHLTEGVDRAVKRAKGAAGYRCEVTGKGETRHSRIVLDGHHLFDRSSRPDLVDLPENILVVMPEIHRGFHSWKPGPCTPRDFLEYLESQRADLFDAVNSSSMKRIQALARRLTRLQTHETIRRPQYR